MTILPLLAWVALIGTLVSVGVSCGGSRVVRVRHHLLDLGLQPLTQWFAFWPTIGGTRPRRPTLACYVRLTPMCLTCRIKGRWRAIRR
jgi:hypothetical protein